MQNNQTSQGELARHEGAGGMHAAHGVNVQDVLGRRRGQLEALLPQKTPFSPQTPWLLPRRLHIRTWAPQSSEESTREGTSEEGNPPSFSAWIQYGFMYSGILFYPPFHLLQSIMSLIFSVNCLITAGVCFKIQHRDHSRQ